MMSWVKPSASPPRAPSPASSTNGITASDAWLGSTAPASSDAATNCGSVDRQAGCALSRPLDRWSRIACQAARSGAKSSASDWNSRAAEARCCLGRADVAALAPDWTARPDARACRTAPARPICRDGWTFRASPPDGLRQAVPARRRGRHENGGAGRSASCRKAGCARAPARRADRRQRVRPAPAAAPRQACRSLARRRG